MNELKIFEQREVLGKDFRIYGNIENPLFMAKDVAIWIEYDTNKVNEMVAMVDEEEKLTETISWSGQRRKMWFLTENGLYEVLMQSRKPIAKEFKTKVKEILKTIRKTGGYVANDELFVNTYLPHADENTKELFKLNLTVIRQLNNKLDEQKPLVEFAEQVISSEDTVDIGQMAKLASDNNFKIGRNKLCVFLREKGMFMKNNIPYQKYMNVDLFEVVEIVKKIGNDYKVFLKTMIKPKGQIKIIEMLKAEFDSKERVS
jgi:prophage antirepressor-like protein